jgi:hypothetical protein
MKTWTLTTLTLISITAGLSFGPWPAAEPSYHNRKLTAWLDDLETLDRPTFDRAAHAVEVIGIDALPTLRRLLRNRDSVLWRELIGLCEAFPAQRLDSADTHYDGALQACRILGSPAVSLTPEVLPFLSGNRQSEAVKVLVALGEDTIPALEEALAGPDADRRAGAAVALGTLACRPRTVVPALAARLTDTNAETRMAVAGLEPGRFGRNCRR